MLLRILSRTGTLEKLKGKLHTGKFGREFHWGRKNDPCVLYLNEANPPPEKPIPGGTQLDIAHVRIVNRNQLHAEKHDESTSERDLFIAVNLLLPPDFKGERPIEVARLSNETWLSDRLFCDSCQLERIGLSKRPMLSLHAYVLIRKGEVARLIHQLPFSRKTGCWYILYHQDTPKIIYHDDYTLAPAPLDNTQPLPTEKAPILCR